MYYDLFLDCVKECHDGIPVFAGKGAELLDSVACVALSRYSVPHDGLYRIAGAAVVESVGCGGTGDFLMQAACP